MGQVRPWKDIFKYLNCIIYVKKRIKLIDNYLNVRYKRLSKHLYSLGFNKQIRYEKIMKYGYIENLMYFKKH